jgi:hypothetical protein
MAVWQRDILVGPVVGEPGVQTRIVTGIDDHSRYCVIAMVVARASGRAVCLPFAQALGR